jgi:hypothetical protein
MTLLGDCNLRLSSPLAGPRLVGTQYLTTNRSGPPQAWLLAKALGTSRQTFNFGLDAASAAELRFVSYGGGAQQRALAAEEFAGKLVAGHGLLDGDAALNRGGNTVVVFDYRRGRASTRMMCGQSSLASATLKPDLTP